MRGERNQKVVKEDIMERPWVGDPELGDMKDPQYREEMFRIFKHDFVDPPSVPTLMRQFSWS
jgi:hypothetical protein